MQFVLDKWFESKKTGEVLLQRTGEFTSDYIDSILPSIEEGLCKAVTFDNIRKKTFHVFVECIQNLFHHVDPIDYVGKEYGEARLGALVLSKEGPFCHICTGNFVNKTRQAKLMETFDHLNSLTENEIKKLYRETINNHEFSEKGGAGIGMIDIARKTDCKLLYQFYPVDGQPDVLFFSFEVYIC